jgi:hypothetical protein
MNVPATVSGARVISAGRRGAPERSIRTDLRYRRWGYLALAVAGVECRVARDPHEHDDHNDLRQEHGDEPAWASP